MSLRERGEESKEDSSRHLDSPGEKRGSSSSGDERSPDSESEGVASRPPNKRTRKVNFDPRVDALIAQMHRYFGFFVLVAAATALPKPSETKLEDVLTIPSIPFTSSIMVLKEGAAKIIKAAPLTNVVIPSPELRSVMVVGDKMSPKVEEVLEMKDEAVVIDAPKLEEVKPETNELEKEEKEVTMVSEMPKEEIKKPEIRTDKFVSYVKLPALSNLLPTISWPNWSNILPISWTTGNLPILGSTRDFYYTKGYPYLLVKSDKV